MKLSILVGSNNYYNGRISRKRKVNWRDTSYPIRLGGFLCSRHFFLPSFFFDEVTKKRRLLEDASPDDVMPLVKNVVIIDENEMLVREEIVSSNVAAEEVIDRGGECGPPATDEKNKPDLYHLNKVVALDHSYAPSREAEQSFNTLKVDHLNLMKKTKQIEKQLQEMELVNTKLNEEIQRLKHLNSKLESKLTQESNFSEEAKEIFLNELKNAGRSPTQREYSNKIIDISLIQRYHSNAGKIE